MKKPILIAGAASVVLLCAGSTTAAFKTETIRGMALPRLTASGVSGHVPAILPLRERKAVMDRLVEARLERILPEAMRRHGFDMWLVISSQSVEDPVFRPLVPYDPWAVRRLGILVFFDRGAQGIERLLIAHHGKAFYSKDWDQQHETQWEALARVVRARDPQRIGINQASKVLFGDGLTAGLKEKLVAAIGPRYAARLASAEDLAVLVLEQRLPEEIELYHQVIAITRAIIREAFSFSVITPGVTTTDDVRWWMQQRIVDLGLEPMSLGSVLLARAGSDRSIEGVIRRGDAIHCDFGLQYLGLYSDLHEWAYVPRVGETEVPAGLSNALAKANRMQDILMSEFRDGRSGNEIQAAALAQGRAEGLAPRVYTHPIGLHLHAAGAFIGTPDRQNPAADLEIEARRGDYPVHARTAHSIELSVDVPIPEWGGQVVRFAVEQQAFFDPPTFEFIGGRQTAVYLVK